MFQRLLIIFLVFMFSNAVFADEIKLYKKGTRVLFKEDTHCMSNGTALKLSNKFKLCEETSKLKFEGLKKLHKLELDALKKKLDIKESMYQDIIQKKDKTIFDIQQVTLEEFSKYKDNTWLTVTVSVVVGLAVGSGIAILANYYAK